MKEIEVKILDIDQEKIEKTLKENNILFNEKTLLQSVFLKNNSGDIVRIRKNGEKIEVVTKKNERIQNNIKIADEFEFISTDDFCKILNFFENIGFEIFKIFQKERKTYYFDEIQIFIENDFCIPTTLEIEWKNFEEILKTAEKIGFSEKDFSGKTEKEVYNFYNIEKWKEISREKFFKKFPSKNIWDFVIWQKTEMQKYFWENFEKTKS